MKLNEESKSTRLARDSLVRRYGDTSELMIPIGGPFSCEYGSFVSRASGPREQHKCGTNTDFLLERTKSLRTQKRVRPKEIAQHDRSNRTILTLILIPNSFEGSVPLKLDHSELGATSSGPDCWSRRRVGCSCGIIDVDLDLKRT